jgi:hypothetical protein
MSLDTSRVAENEIPGTYELDGGKLVLEINADHTYVHRYRPDSGGELSHEGTWEYPVSQIDGVHDMRLNDFYALDSTWHRHLSSHVKKFDPDSSYWNQPRTWHPAVVKDIWGTVVIIVRFGDGYGYRKQ